MEDMLWKFPHVGQQIFKKLSNKNLAKSKKLAKSWKNFITNEKFYKEKVYFETRQKERDEYGGMSPLEKAAWDGNLQEYRLFIKYVEDKNPKINFGRTPLHYAARKGHLFICKLIIDNVEDKNPKDTSGETPLHEAAYEGHFDVVKLIIDENNVEDKNPKDVNGTTPLHEAAYEGHYDVFKLIFDKTKDIGTTNTGSPCNSRP